MTSKEIKKEIRSIREQVNQLLCLARQYEEKQKALKSHGRIPSATPENAAEFNCSVREVEVSPV
jgi:hypothetical protein